MKPRSEACAKQGADSFSSFEERSLEGLVGALWILKSPATRYGCLSSRRDDSGETEWGDGGSGLA